MPKLPSNLVKPPAFDNPLRRTTPAPVSLPEPYAAAESPTPDVEAGQGGGVVIPIAATTRTDGDHDLVPMPHRITVRIDDPTRRALEAECYRRRIAGEKTNVADIARGILKNWTNRTE
jgi:hypothetical protein